MEKNAEYGEKPKMLALLQVIKRPITVFYEDSDKGTVFREFFTDRPSIDILYYPGKRDDKGERVKATLLSQPENEKVYSLW